MKTTMILLTTLLLQTGWVQNSEPSRYVVSQESRIWIDGTSNVHDWTCETAALEGFVETDESWDSVTAEFSVLISGFECKNGKMDKKLQDALKAEDHPVTSFALDSTMVTHSSTSAEIQLIARGRLTVAGVTKTIMLTVSATPLPDGGHRLTGELPILMKDYDVKPPRALMGLIKTGKRVSVRFEIVVAPPRA